MKGKAVSRGVGLVPGVGAFIAASAVSPAGLAAPSRDPESSYGWERRFAFSLHVGLRSPLGAGVAYEVSPVNALALEGGIGQGEEGIQSAIGARVRVRARSVAVSAGAGLSAGPFRADNADCQVFLTLGCSDVGPTQSWRWSRAVWRNIELSLERRSTFGFSWRFYWGVGTILNPEDAVCTPLFWGSTPQPRCRATSFSSPYVGTSIGYAF